MSATHPNPDAAALRSAFAAADAYTVGLEEEAMLLHPESGELIPAADRALELVDGDPRFKRELPAAQLEIMTAPAPTVAEAAAELSAGRRDLADACAGQVALACAGVHPWAPAEGELNRGIRYEEIHDEYGSFARRQLVFALQVHVAPGDPDRALAIYNALRSYLPEVAALAANAPYHGGADTGLASVRPKITEHLPRQGIPPPLSSWDDYAGALRWGRTAGVLQAPGSWWWELRPHPRFGTLELRVPDAQTTVAEAAAIAAFVQCLVASLGRRFDAGEHRSPAPNWRIAENRWLSARDGVEGSLADLETGERRPARDRLSSLIESLTGIAHELGCADELAACRDLLRENGALRQRKAVAERGLGELVGWLTGRWLVGIPRAKADSGASR